MFKSFPQKQFHTLRQAADMRWTRRERKRERERERLFLEGALGFSSVQLKVSTVATPTPPSSCSFHGCVVESEAVELVMVNSYN